MLEPAKQQKRTVASAINEIAAQFAAADLVYGHGTGNADDEAAWLVFDALDLDFAGGPQLYERPVADHEWSAMLALAAQRVERRVPLAYLLKHAYFAGLRFYVDERVLVPRSPLAEVIVARFEPWLKPQDVKRAVDLGTGSGCIAIAIAQGVPGYSGRCGRYFTRRAGRCQHQYQRAPNG